jgi:hypothetical protein
MSPEHAYEPSPPVAGCRPAADERLARLDLARDVLAEGGLRAKRDERGAGLGLVAFLERRLNGAEIVGVHAADAIGGRDQTY